MRRDKVCDDDHHHSHNPAKFTPLYGQVKANAVAGSGYTNSVFGNTTTINAYSKAPGVFDMNVTAFTEDPSKKK